MDMTEQRRKDLQEAQRTDIFAIVSTYPRYAEGRVTSDELNASIWKRLPEVSDRALERALKRTLTIDDQVEVSGLLSGVLADMTRLNATRAIAAGEYGEE